MKIYTAGENGASIPVKGTVPRLLKIKPLIKKKVLVGT